MEDKETRFGVCDTGLSLAIATDSTVGAGNFTYHSLTPIGVLVAIVDMRPARSRSEGWVAASTGCSRS